VAGGALSCVLPVCCLRFTTNVLCMHIRLLLCLHNLMICCGSIPICEPGPSNKTLCFSMQRN
jgi:hypothetical protein